jgi:hypothetical protein
MCRALLIAVTLVVTGCLVDDESESAPTPLEGLEQAPCELTDEEFAIVGVDLPRNAQEAERLGFDLDGDPEGRVDNAAGVLLALLQTHHGAQIDLQERVNRQLRKLSWHLRVQRCSASSHARVILEGPGDTPTVPAVGVADGDSIRAAGGIGAVPPALLFDLESGGTPTGWSLGLSFAAELTIDGDQLDGRIGLGLLPSEIAREASDAFVAEIAVGDIDLEARYRGALVYWPRHDGRYDRVSLGLGIRAVR